MTERFKDSRFKDVSSLLMKKKEEVARLTAGKEVMRLFKVLDVKKSSVNLKS